MDTEGTRVWLIVWKTYEALHKCAVRSIESLDMCVTDFAILELLLHKGPSPVNALGAKLSLASGSITAAVDRLEKRGLVTRKASTEDRRTKIVDLTKQGKKLIQESFEAHSLHMEKATQALSEKERTQLIALLKRLGKSVDLLNAQ